MKNTITCMTALCLIGVLAGCHGAPQNDATTEQASAAGSAQPAAPASDNQATAQQTPGQQAQAEPQQQPPAPRPATPRPRPATQAAAAPQDMPKPEPVRPAMVSVPAGTVIVLSTDTGLNSKTAQVDQPITATVVDDVRLGDRTVIPAGSTLHGRVTEAVAAKRGAGNAKLSVAFDTLEVQGGYRTQIIGTLQEATESKKKRNAAIIGGSAAGGAVLGKILGKDTKSAVIGSVIAGGIGTAVVMGKEGEQAKLPADTPFEIKLEEAVQVPHEASRS